MTEHPPDLYDELGVSRDASADALRSGYRRRARQLHPDVADEATTADAMRRVNEAWVVLSDPTSRQRYDQSLDDSSRPAPANPARQQRAEVYDPGAIPSGRRAPFLRPSALILFALAVIFVVTAYAGSWPGDQGGPSGSISPSPPAAAPGARDSTGVVGQCLADQAGQTTVVPCSAPNDGQILAQVAVTGVCPTGTVGHQWRLRSAILCATVTPRPAAP